LNKEPIFPKNVTIKIKDIKDRMYCKNCGASKEMSLLEGFELSKATITEESINIPIKTCCKNPKPIFYIGTKEYITGDVTLPYVKARLERNGVVLV